MKIVDFGMNGEGVAKEYGKVFFVDGALSDEEVDVEIVKENSKFVLAKAKKIIKKSEFRVESPCPYFQICGGCDLQHLCYEKQLEFKQNLVKNTIKKIANIDQKVQKTVASNNIYNYRIKNVFPAMDKKVGMFKKNSKELIEINECKIANDETNKILQLCNKSIDKDLKYLVVQNGVVSLVVDNEKADISKIENVLSLNNIPYNINVNKEINKRILSTHFIHKTDKVIYKKMLNVEYETNIGCFEQINEDIKQKIYSKVLENINSSDIVLDAFCGSGLLSAIIAKKCKKCVGVEIYQPAIVNAKNLAKQNKINNLFFMCGDCVDVVPQLRERFSTVILDPPRSGCGEKVIESVLKIRPQKIIYISCNPISLAKELKLLSSDYKISLVVPFDMFPQTKRIETLCILEYANC